jgi:hypothetical protein
MKPMKFVDFEQIRMKILGRMGTFKMENSGNNDTNSLLLKYFIYKEFFDDSKLKELSCNEN